MDRTKARERLIERRKRAEDIVRAATEQGSVGSEQGDVSGELSNYDQHPADSATETLDRELDLSVRESAEAHLEDIDAALKRIDDGGYGTCEVCDQPIPDGRLEAKPEARFCVDHEPRTTTA